MKYIGILLALLSCSVLAAQNTNFRPETNTYYTGTVDGKYAFNMVLSKEGEVCMGSYYYLKHKRPVFLYGRCSNSTFNFQEQQRQIGYTAGVGFRALGQHRVITGTMVGNRMSGFLHAHDSEKIHPFSAKKIEPNKRAILTNAVGIYKIYHIGGSCCANSFLEYIKSDDFWSAMGSAASPSDQLSKQDKHLLSSFTLVLDTSLEIHMFSANHFIAALPYTNKSIFSVRKISQQEDAKNNTGRIFKYDGVSTFVDNVLHIATTDTFKLLPFVVAPLQEQSSRHAISVDYDPSAMEFQITIISEQCCARATLYLRKQ